MKLLTLIFSLFCLLACMEQTKEKIYDPAELRIAYNVLYNEQTAEYEVFTMNLDGSDPKNISTSPGVDWTHHASGKYIYFLSSRDSTQQGYFLYRMQHDGSGVKKLSDIRMRDSRYSARNNGSEILVCSHQSVDTAFYIIDSAGNIKQRIQPQLAYFSDPIFSPDGSRIVFRGATSPSKFEVGHTDHLYIMNADGTNMKQLTSYPKNDTTAPWYAYRSGPPQWHPTENFISFGSYRDGMYQLFAVDPDGSNERKLLDDFIYGSVWHAWSPDGKWLVLDVSLKDKAPFRIGLVDWPTREFRLLSDSTYRFNQYPVFVEVSSE